MFVNAHALVSKYCMGSVKVYLLLIKLASYIHTVQFKSQILVKVEPAEHGTYNDGTLEPEADIETGNSDDLRNSSERNDEKEEPDLDGIAMCCINCYGYEV